MVPGPWTGFYIGGNLGYGWTNTIGDYSLTGNPHTTGTFVGSPVDLDGANGGFQVGYNWQTGNFLIGGEADIQGSGQNQTFNYICGAACTVSQNAKLDWFSTFRGRAGIAIKDVLFYGTGGFAWTHSDNAFSGTFGGTPTSLASTLARQLGMDGRRRRRMDVLVRMEREGRISLSRQYRRQQRYRHPCRVGRWHDPQSTANASDNIVRAGVNYHIGYPIGGGWPSRW